MWNVKCKKDPRDVSSLRSSKQNFTVVNNKTYLIICIWSTNSIFSILFSNLKNLFKYNSPKIKEMIAYYCCSVSYNMTLILT